MVDTRYPFHIVTSRLILRDYTPDDIAAVWEVESDPEIHRYERPPSTYEQVSQKINTNIAQAGQDTGLGLRPTYQLAVILSAEAKLIGRVHLTLHIANIREWEIGWTIHTGYWGRGYATEAARVLLQFAFTQANAHRVIAFCHAGNTASARVMEKIGMRREAHLRETVWLNERWWDEYCYAILEREYPLPGQDGVK